MFTKEKIRPTPVLGVVASGVVVAATFWLNRSALAHCDTMDGPVVSSAKRALTLGKPEPVLRWVRPSDEKEIRSAFKASLEVRKESPEAKRLADTYFFETVVRLHRAGEREPYDGLKPAGSPVDPAIAKADESLKAGSVDRLAKDLAREIEEGIRHRFLAAQQAGRSADSSVANGRTYVSAYVQFMHFVEEVDHLAKSKSGTHGLHAEPPH